MLSISATRLISVTGLISKQIVHSLLGHGADINAYDEKHGSVLAAATSRKTYSRRGDEAIGSSEVLRAIVEFLLRHEPKV